MPTYLGRNIVSMPSSPVAPASIEFSLNAITGATTSTFTGQQQITDFNNRWWEASVAMPPMSKADGQAWATFFRNCDGMAGVFLFPSATVADYPEELTTDGTTARYFCLKTDSVRWSVKPGKIYSVTFEVREAT